MNTIIGQLRVVLALPSTSAIRHFPMSVGTRILPTEQPTSSASHPPRACDRYSVGFARSYPQSAHPPDQEDAGYCRPGIGCISCERSSCERSSCERRFGEIFSCATRDLNGIRGDKGDHFPLDEAISMESAKIAQNWHLRTSVSQLKILAWKQMWLSER
jgi:hypothetical protein